MAQLLKTDSPTLAGRRTGFIQFNLNKSNKKTPLKYISNPAFQLLWFVENTWNAERVFVQCRAHFLLLWTCIFSLFHRFRCFLCISISVDPVHTPKPKHPLSLSLTQAGARSHSAPPFTVVREHDTPHTHRHTQVRAQGSVYLSFHKASWEEWHHPFSFFANVHQCRQWGHRVKPPPARSSLYDCVMVCLHKYRVT